MKQLLGSFLVWSEHFLLLPQQTAIFCLIYYMSTDNRLLIKLHLFQIRKRNSLFVPGPYYVLVRDSTRLDWKITATKTRVTKTMLHDG